MDFKERYEFCKKIELYAQQVAVCLAKQMNVEQQIACERVIGHLGIVIEMMLDDTSPQDVAVILVPESTPHYKRATQPTDAIGNAKKRNIKK